MSSSGGKGARGRDGRVRVLDVEQQNIFYSRTWYYVTLYHGNRSLQKFTKKKKDVKHRQREEIPEVKTKKSE